MSYAGNLELENVSSQFLAVMQPRRRVTNYALHSGFVYLASFSLGDIEAVSVNGVSLSLGSSTSLSAGEYFVDGQNLYVRTPESSNPNTEITVVTYNIYIASQDAYWYMDPLDDETEIVYFEPVIERVPFVKSTTSDVLYGYLPTQRSTLDVNNAEHIFEPHISVSSFNKASIKIYHYLGDLEIANVKLIYDGILSDIAYKSGKISFSMLDRVDLLDTEYRQSNQSFFNTTTFAAVNPNMIGKPIRTVYGLVNGFVPVNVDYVDQEPTTSDNRDWVVVAGQTGLSEIVRTVPASPSSTATRTYLNFCEGITVGDTVKFDRVSGTDEYFEVTNVSYSPAYIEHATLSSGAMASGDSVKKGFVSRVEIIQNGVRYLAHYGRDYTVSTAMSGGTSGFIFSSSLESNLSIPETLSPNDTVYCRVYGRVNDLDLDSETFGANDLITNNITNPVMVLLDLLKNKLSFSEDTLNITNFESMYTETDDQALGFAIPENSTDSFPTYKNLVIDILRTGLFRFFTNDDGKWTISILAPLSTTDYSVDEQEIFDGSFDYDFKYSDILSDVSVQYAHREIAQDLAIQGESALEVTAHSDHAQYFHNVNAEKSFKSLYFRETDAQVLCNRLLYTLSERSGIFKFSMKFRLFPATLNDVVMVNRYKLPGFEFDVETQRSASGSVVDITKKSSSIDIEIDDQLGIENNEGSW